MPNTNPVYTCLGECAFNFSLALNTIAESIKSKLRINSKWATDDCLFNPIMNPTKPPIPIACRLIFQNLVIMPVIIISKVETPKNTAIISPSSTFVENR